MHSYKMQKQGYPTCKHHVYSGNTLSNFVVFSCKFDRNKFGLIYIAQLSSQFLLASFVVL